MEVIHLGVFPGIGENLLNQGLPGCLIGVTEVGIGGNSPEQLPLAMDLSNHLPDIRREGIVLHTPAGVGISQSFRRPAVADPMVFQATQGYGLGNLLREAIHLLFRKGLTGQCGIENMLVPAFKKHIGLLELKEKSIVAVLGQPVDKIQHIFQCVRSFNANPSMP